MKYKFTESEISEVIIKSILGEPVFETTGGQGRVDSNFLEKWNFPEHVFEPSDHLISRIAEYNQWSDIRKKTNKLTKMDIEKLGKLMEEIAVIAFSCLKGWDSIKSYQSYSAQHDLVIFGADDHTWLYLMMYLQLPRDKRTIVVEAKNLDGSVSDAQFSRLCGIISNKFESSCYLGVFFSSQGASGFPQGNHRQRSLKDARATQILFHAKTGKFVIVLDDNDLQLLPQKGALPRILKSKIKDVEEAGGLSLEFNENWQEIDLPPHLSQYVV